MCAGARVTPTEAVIAQITAELRARQAEIDARRLDTIEVSVHLDPETGLPRRLGYRTESHRNLAPVPRRRAM